MGSSSPPASAIAAHFLRQKNQRAVLTARAGYNVLPPESSGATTALGAAKSTRARNPRSPLDVEGRGGGSLHVRGSCVMWCVVRPVLVRPSPALGSHIFWGRRRCFSNFGGSWFSHGPEPQLGSASTWRRSGAPLLVWIHAPSLQTSHIMQPVCCSKRTERSPQDLRERAVLRSKTGKRNHSNKSQQQNYVVVWTPFLFFMPLPSDTLQYDYPIHASFWWVLSSFRRKQARGALRKGGRQDYFDVGRKRRKYSIHWEGGVVRCLCCEILALCCMSCVI